MQHQDYLLTHLSVCLVNLMNTELSGEEGGRPAGYGQSVGTTRTQEGQVPLSQ